MFFLAHILNRPVLDASGRRLGWVEDLVLTSLDLFPTVAALVLARRGRRAVFVPWRDVAATDATVIRLWRNREEIETSPLDENAIFLRRDILDKQVVDIHGRKVVRVNDLQLASVDSELRLIGADIGVRGLLRRLNLERPATVMAHTMNASLPARVIPWNYVEGLETEWSSLRLNVSHRRLRELPATDIADILAQMHPIDREELVTRFDDETLADTLPHLEEDMQAEVISAMTDQRASDIMEILPPDEAADVLGDLSEERAERILHLMEPDEAEDVRELLQYPDDTAGGLMTTEYIALSDGMTAGEALTHLRGVAPDAETVYYIYLIGAAGALEGVISLRDLITAPADVPIDTLAHRDVIQVQVTDDQETVAHTLNHYHLLAVPVVDSMGVLLGIVTVDDVLDVLSEEAEEDISRQAGAVEESGILATPWEQVALRLPWMLGASLAGMLVALLLSLHAVAGSETLIPLLAILPLLVLLGVQNGGQGAAAVQVGLGEGEETGDILRGLSQRQWPVGIALSLLGSVMAGAVVYIAGLPSHALPVAVVVLLALLLNMLVGSLLPMLLHRLHWDPVLVSRPALAAIALLIGASLLVGVL